MPRTYNCNYCGESGHNIRSCGYKSRFLHYQGQIDYIGTQLHLPSVITRIRTYYGFINDANLLPRDYDTLEDRLDHLKAQYQIRFPESIEDTSDDSDFESSSDSSDSDNESIASFQEADFKIKPYKFHGNDRQILMYEEETLKTVEKETCSICCSEEENCSTTCGHRYCVSCIVKHLKVNSNCPMCRERLVNEERKTIIALF